MVAVTELNTTQTIIAAIVTISVTEISGYFAMKLAALKDHINSRMDELLRLNTEAKQALGNREGRAEMKAEMEQAILISKAAEPKAANVVALPPQND